MKPQYQHDLMTSFLLWFDNHLLQKGEAYTNKTGQLYQMDDSRLPSDYRRYSSPYKQWVSDSSITGASNPIIPTTVAISGSSPVSRVAGNYGFDFENGGIIYTGAGVGIGTGAVLTGAFAVKDFNVYLTNKTEEDLIIETKHIQNSRYTNEEPATGIKPYDQAVPAVFINSEIMKNEGFAFGGEDMTTNTIKAVILAENEYQLDGVLSIFADTRYKTIEKIPFTGHPVTEYGDIKNGTYSYRDLSNTYKSANPYYIQDVTVSKFSNRSQEAIPGDILVGFIDFDVSLARFPRA